jgi:hypothetical protein
MPFYLGLWDERFYAAFGGRQYLLSAELREGYGEEGYFLCLPSSVHQPTLTISPYAQNKIKLLSYPRSFWQILNYDRSQSERRLQYPPHHRILRDPNSVLRPPNQLPRQRIQRLTRIILSDATLPSIFAGYWMNRSIDADFAELPTCDDVQVK